MSIFNEARSIVKSLKYSEYTKSLINSFSKTFIFPLNFITSINNTNNGLKSSNAIRNRFYQFESIVSGNESIFLNWNNSTFYTQVNSNKLDGEDTSHWDIEFKKGDFFKGYLWQENGSTQFSTTSFGTFGEFTTTTNQNIIKIQSTQHIDLKMLTQFYLIPNQSNINNDDYQDNSIFYISSFQNYRNNLGAFTYADIEFTSLQQELSQSGQAIQQKVYFSSPGQGYAFPRIIYNEKGEAIDFEIHPEFAKDNGVKTIQLEIVGNAAICAVEVYGSPIKEPKKNNNSLYAPRKLLIEEFRLPVQDDFLLVSTASNSFYMSDITLQAITEFESWQKRRKELVGDKQMDYQGIIYTSKETLNTNTSNRTIADIENVVNNTFLQKNGNNGILDTSASHWFYDGTTFDSSGNPIKGIGLQKIDLTKLERKQFKDVMNMMSYCTNFINQLPFVIQSKITWSLRDFWLIGGFLNKITFGFPIFWRQIYSSSSLFYPGLETLPMIIPKANYDFFSSSAFASDLNPDTSDIKKIPLDIFQSSESSTLGAIFGNKSTTTAINFTLTDKMTAMAYNHTTKAKIGKRNISTLLLSQEKLNGSVKEYFKVDESSIELNSLTDVGIYTDIRGEGKYIITGIGLRMLGDGDVRITMYQDDLDYISEDPTNPNEDFNQNVIRNSIVYQSILKSEAGYRNQQIREWLTFQKTSFVEAITAWDKPFDFPNPYPTPAPDTNLPSLEIGFPSKGEYFNKFLRFTKPKQTGEMGRQDFLVYDFAEQNITNLQQIYDNYDSISISTNLLSSIAILYSEDEAGTTEFQRDSKTSNSISFLITSIKDTLPTGWPENYHFNSNAISQKSAIGGNQTYSRSDIRAGLYFDGVKLTMAIDGIWELQSWEVSNAPGNGTSSRAIANVNNGKFVVKSKSAESLLLLNKNKEKN